MKLKVRSTPRFLSAIHDGVGTKVRKDGLATYVDLDYSLLEALSSFDPSTKQFAVVDRLTGEWNKTTLSDVLAVSGYVATSLTPETIGLGTISFTTQAGLAYRAGARVRASSTVNTSNYMEGLVTSYSGTTLTVAISLVSGSGTFSSWNLSLAGDPGSGDMLSTNNGLDFANKDTALNNLGGVSFSATQTLTSPQKLKARQNIGVVGGSGVLNILDYGGVADGATDNYAAFNLAYAALGAFGGSIYFPAGKYVFSSALAKTLANARFAVGIIGDGSTSTTLYWPNSAGGMTFTQANVQNAIHFQGVSVTTGVTNGGTGISLVGIATGSKSVWSTFDDVEVKGDDGGGTTFYWTTAIKAHIWSLINFDKVNTYGSSAGLGNGVVLEGSNPDYGILYNFTACTMNYHNFGLTYGDFVQGVSVSQCNFNGNVGLAAIYNPAGCTGILAQLAVSDSQFNYSGDQLSINSGINQVKLTNNIVTVSANGHTGLYLPIASDFTVIGNSFNLAGSPTTTTGIVAGPPGFGIITGNNFQGYALGYNLLASSANIIHHSNPMSGVTTPYVNSGSSPNPSAPLVP